MFFPGLNAPVLAVDSDSINSSIDCGSDASLDDLNPATVMAWIKPLSLIGGNRWFGKGNSPTQEFQFAANANLGDVRIVRTRATINLQYNTNTTPIATLGRWHYVATWFDTSASGQQAAIYHGTQSKPAVEQTYSTSNNGSGALNTDAAANLFLCASAASGQGWNGHLWCLGLVNRRLSLPEICDFQFNPRPLPGMVGLWFPGAHGLARAWDFSGKGNHGTPSSSLALASGMQLVDTPDRDWPGGLLYEPTAAPVSNVASRRIRVLLAPEPVPAF